MLKISNKILIISGPTATGKTGVAINLHTTDIVDRSTYSCALAKYCNLPECELKNNLQA